MYNLWVRQVGMTRITSRFCYHSGFAQRSLGCWIIRTRYREVSRHLVLMETKLQSYMYLLTIYAITYNHALTLRTKNTSGLGKNNALNTTILFCAVVLVYYWTPTKASDQGPAIQFQSCIPRLLLSPVSSQTSVLAGLLIGTRRPTPL